MYFTTTLALLPALALALQVTSPSKNAVWDTSKDQKVVFSSVNTDPTSVDIVLVNFSTFPTTSTVLVENYDTSKGSYDVTASQLAGLSAKDGYQINLLNPNNNGILAQSGTFEVEQGAAAQTTGTSSSSTATATTVSGTRTTVSTSTMSSTNTSTNTPTGTGSTTAQQSPSVTESGTSPTRTGAAVSVKVGMGGVLAAVLAGLAAVL